MQCIECQGTGKISCGACWNGHRKSICPDCGGKGQVTGVDGKTKDCTRCGGLGEFVPPSCPKCGNGIVCPVCGGSGQVGVPS